MWCHRPFSYPIGLVVITFAVMASFPAAAAGENVPAEFAALLPAKAQLDRGNWAVFETEFGHTFGGDLQAASFPGQRPSCPFAGTPELNVSLTGDTAFENPPMLEMVISDFEAGVKDAPAAMSRFVTAYVVGAPDVVSVGAILEEPRPDGHLVFIEYQENCSNHPSGAKTRLKGFARRGATQLEFDFVVALDSAGAKAMAVEILDNFAKLDIAALTP